MKRILSLVLTLVLTLSFGFTALAEEAPVPLTVFAAGNRPENAHTEKTHQFYLEELGVDWQLQQGDYNNFLQQLALYISGNEIPDVMKMAYNAFYDYAREGLFADLAPYIDDYPNLKKYAERVGDYWSYVSVDGAIYGIPNLGNSQSNLALCIRQDWLDNLGLSMPATLAELTEVLHAFTFDDPDQNGVDDTYGISGCGYAYLAPLFGAFGASAEQYFILQDDGTVRTNAVSAQYKEALKYLRDQYAAGVVDPEFFTQTNFEQVGARWARGNFGIWSGMYSWAGMAYAKLEFGTLQPDAKVALLPAPIGENGESGTTGTNALNGAVGISFQCSEEEIRAALKWMDFQVTNRGFAISLLGTEGEYIDWNYEDDVLAWSWGIEGKSKSGADIADMQLYCLLANEPLSASFTKLAAESESASEQTKLVMQGNDMRFNQPTYSNLFNCITTSEYLDLNSELQTYFASNMTAFIMGDKDIEAEWDGYVSGYLSMGGEEVRQSLLKAYNELCGTSYTFAD